MLTLRAGSGLGDSIYLQSIVQHLCFKRDIEVRTDFPELFSHLPVRAAPFSRHNCTVVHYTKGKEDQRFTQFDDMQKMIGLRKVDLRLDWTLKNTGLREYFNRPTLIVHMLREPMDRGDNFGIELLPNGVFYDQVLGLLKKTYQIILVGKGRSLYDLHNVDVDLTNKTRLTDLIDLCWLSDGLVSQVSFMIPLAESLDKKVLSVWSARGFISGERYISTITPKKILHKDNPYLVDDDDLYQFFGDTTPFSGCENSDSRQRAECAG